jgi:AcrR family transcriptional regulator
MTPDRTSHETPAYFAEFVPGRRGEILDAALAVFAEKGYEGGTMRQIAALVGVTEPALYRHYAGKEALFEDMVATAGGRVVSGAAALLAKIRPDNLRESLKILIEERRRKGSDVQPIMHTLMLAAPHNPALREVFRRHVAWPMVANLRELIPRVDGSLGIQRSAEEVEARVRAFMSLFVGYFMTSMMFEDTSADDAIVDAMLAVMGWDAPVRER